LKDLGIDGRIILKWIIKKWDGACLCQDRDRRRAPVNEDNIKMGIYEVGWGIDWIYLAQDWDRWWTLVNAVMIKRVKCLD
jgi:hypothetical protein